ncbi:MAG: phosphoadenylyl-sulfate reductase [Rhizobiales bacterium]|nr:phosphoadenylyl-sulfate reductase [Hyphomicrobiales bacterium]
MRAGLDGAELLSVLIEDDFRERIALVSSFGGESAVLLHMISQIDRSTPVLFLDTGFLFPETLDYQRELTFLLGLSDVRILRPDAIHESEFDAARDLHLSHPNVCCFFRKVVPLRNGLAPFSAWISGRKRYQGADRTELDLLERDGRHIKANPLAAWTAEDVSAYISRHALPAHPLVADGYPSIGCEPCTTPVVAGEDPRAGRWRGTEVKECGIHFADGRAVRGAA